MMTLFPRLLLLITLLLPWTALAEIPQGMESDFAPLSGYIIMPIGDEFLVDLDATANLQEGDILTLVMPGEKVVHPVTKEILGTIDIPKGYLQVSRLKSGYSYAKLLYSEIAPEKGNQIKRFEQVQTALKATDNKAELLQVLKTGLPQLDWLAEDSSTEPLLTFELAGQQLLVKNSSDTILHSYQLIDGQIVAPAAQPQRNHGFSVDADPAQNKGFLNRTANKLLDSVGLGNQKNDPFSTSGIIRNTDSNDAIWMGDNLEGSPAGLVVADLDRDGLQETVVAFETRIAILKIKNGAMQEVDSISLPAGKAPLSIASADLDNNGAPEIYVTASKDYELASLAIEFRDNQYQIFQDNLRWFMTTAALPGEGSVLLAQRQSNEASPFYGKPFRVTRSGDELSKGTELDLPLHVGLYGFSYAATGDGAPLVAYLSEDDYLRVVSPQGTALWESGDYFGGSEASFYNKEMGSNAEQMPIYIQKRIVQTAAGEIVVAQNEGLRVLERFRQFKNSRVIAFTWNGFALQEAWRTSEQNGYLADFAIADGDNDGTDELVMIVKFKHKSVLQKARSTVVIYELN